MQHDTRQHAKYGGSVISRIMLCPGSARLASEAPKLPSTPWQIDGTEAHELLDYALSNRIFDAQEASILADRIGIDTGPLKEDRLAAVQTALDYVGALLDAYEDAILYVERPIKFPSLVTNEAWGTLDISVYIPSLYLLYVIDYKHGAGVKVEAKGNKQTRYYAAGAVLGPGFEPFWPMDRAEIIQSVIIQPRCFHKDGPIRPDDVITKSELEQFVREVDQAILRAEDPNAPLIPSDAACEWCPAKITCPAFEAAAMSVVSSNFRTVREVRQVALPDPTQIPIARIVEIKAAAGMLRDWLAEVDSVAYQYAMGGGIVPDWKLVEAQARRHWEGEPQEVAAALMRLADTTDWEVVYPRKLITVTEADDLVGKAFKAKVGRGFKKKAAEDATNALAALTTKESSGNLVLVPVSDKRPAVDRTKVAFASVQSIEPPRG